MLEVPVGIYTTNTDELLVVGGGKYKFVPFPVMPFMITEKEEETEKTEKVRIIGSTLTSEGGKGNRHSGIMTVTPGGDTHIELTYLPTLPFGTNSGRVIDIPSIDYPIELVKEFPEKLGELIGNKPIEPYPLFLDIETATTEEHFPRPDRDPIVSIQLKYRDSKMMILLNEDPGSAIAEIDMLLQFILALEMSSTGKQPDFVVGYFLNKFDIPYIKTRIKKLQPTHPELMTKFQSLARLPASPGGGRQANLYYPNWTFSGRSKGEEIDMVPGLLTLDLFKHAKMDHALTGLPSRSLKRVSTAFGHEVFDLSIDEKKNMKRLLKEDKDRFLKYAGSDILATEYVYGIYESRLISSANLLQCPMSLVHRMSSGQKSYLVMYRECRKNGYYSLNANSSRYFLYDLADKYQGALVDCYHRGYFEHIVYLDAKALYPNIMHDLNVSYDSYTLESVIWYSDWEAEKSLLPNDYQQQIPIGRDQRYTDWPPIISYGPPTERIIYIPDDNYRVVLKFKFDLISDGFIRKLIVRYNSIRDGYKAKAKEYDKKYKESGNIQDRIQSVNYDSAQAEAKVINNTFYGIQGNRYYDFADLPAAIFVTAIGRWIMTEMVNTLGSRAVLELDSVTKDTPVYVKDITTNMLDIIPIEDLHCSKEKIETYEGNYQAWTRSGWQDITYTKKHGVTKPIHRLKCSDAMVECTSDHSVFDPETGHEISPAAITPGDRIEICEPPGVGKVKSSELPLDIDLAWFYGLFLAEGSYSEWIGLQKGKHMRHSRNMSVSIASEVILKKARDICNKKLSSYCTPKGRKPSTTEVYDTMESSSTYRLTGFGSKKSMEFFRYHFYTGNNDSKKVPRDILNCNDKDILSAFIEGYETGDGYNTVSKDAKSGGTRRIRVSTSVDKCITAGIRFVLRRLGFLTGLCIRKDKPNVVDVKVRQQYRNGTYRKIDKEKVSINRVLHDGTNEVMVYDIATSDGTFVSALGEIVLHNTDGVIVNEDHFSMSIDEVNKILRNRISEFFGMPEGNLKFLLEFENRGSIYLHKAKNYILRKDSEPDKLTTVGSAFKGYDKAEVIQNAVRLLSTAVMYKANDASAYSKACEEARDVYGIHKTTGLEPFKFTKIIRRDPHEYKGYRNVDVATSTVDRTQSESKILASMKKKAIVWINTALGKTTERSSNLRRKIRACKDEEQLKLMLTVLAQAQPEHKTAKKHHLTLDIIMRLMQRGRTVEADDTIEYYYTLTKEQYTLAEDMTEDTKLDFHKYLEDINSIIKRFSLADPRTKSLTMMDLIDDPDSAEDLQNSSAGFDEDEDEEDLDV